MQTITNEKDNSNREPSPMAIIGAILAQGAIRHLDRKVKAQRLAIQQIRPPVESLRTPAHQSPTTEDKLHSSYKYSTK